jgi:hypothetical protein
MAFGGGRIVPTSSIGKTKEASSSITKTESSNDISLMDPFMPLPLEKGRNSDMRELTLLVSMPISNESAKDDENKNNDTETLPLHPSSLSTTSLIQVPLVFAAAYGFRNIQGVLSKVKRLQKIQKSSNTNKRIQESEGEGGGSRIGLNKSSGTLLTTSGGSSLTSSSSPFAYVEVMACPSGCINGGGLPKTIDVKDGLSSSSTSPLLNKVRDTLTRSKKDDDSLYYSEPTVTRSRFFELFPELGELCSSSSAIHSSSKEGWSWLTRTRFHILPKLEDGLKEKW